MNARLTNSARLGHSLVELVAATTCSVILLAGLASVVLIARQIAYTPTASSRQLEASSAIRQFADELRVATWIASRSSTAIEFAINDRDGDSVAERIRYEWSGTPGDPLERTYNGGAAIAVVNSVQDLELTYTIDSEAVQLTPLSEGSEVKLISNEGFSTSNSREISANSTTGYRVSQQINPANFTAVPAGTTSWSATRMEFYGRDNGATTETLYVQLRSGGTPYSSLYYGPSSEALGTITIAESGLGSNGWKAYSFPSPIRGLSLTGRYNLVWGCSSSNPACRLYYADTAPTGVFESIEAGVGGIGATWDFRSSRQVFYKLFGTYTTAGAPVNVTRKYLSAVSVLLQPGDATHSRIDASVPLVNPAELTSAVWRADFDSSPTAIDIDGNGTFDWSTNAGNAFNAAAISQGIWTVDVPLESRPLNDFSSVTSIDVRCEAPAVVRINSDRTGGTHGPLIVRLTSASGVQTLTLSGETAANTEKTLATVERLATGMIRVRLLIVPQQNLVQLQVQDHEVGAFVYPTYATTTTDRFISLSGVTGKFDFVEARISSEAIVQ